MAVGIAKLPGARALPAAFGVTALLWAVGVCFAQRPETAAAPSSAVERGRYLVTAGNCLSCHTRPGGAAFSGGVPFETPLGTLYSTNITPEPETGIGRWTEADLRRAMHEGIARDGRYLIPAFPYPSFTKVTAADVADIYAYLRTLPPVRYTPPASGLLLKIRWPLAIWNRMFLTAERFAPDPAKSTEWNRGAYLVEGLGHCGACHSPRNAFLAEQPDRAYTGGVIRDEVSRGRVGRWFAVNLTPAAHGLGSWSVGELEKYLRTGMSPRAGTFGPMNAVIMNSLKLLTPADVHAMAVYVKSLQPKQSEADPVPPGLAAEGATIYKERCEKCHGTSGRGGFFSGPPLAGSAIVQGEDPASLINIIVFGPTTPRAISYGGWETMSAYGNVLSDPDVVAVSNFVRGSWSNHAPPVTLRDVQRLR